MGVLGFFVNSCVAVFGFCSLVFIKRYMGYETVGIIAFSTAYVGLFSMIADMGFGAAHLKKFNEKDLDDAECNGTLLTVKLVLNFVMLAVVLSSIFLQIYIFGDNTISKTTEIILYLTLVRVFIDNFGSIGKNIFSANIARAKIMVPKFIARFIQMVLKVNVA